MPATSLALFFVADGDRLEHQSWLLASSLHHIHAQDPRVRLFAYVSPEYESQIKEETRALYEVCGVELRVLSKQVKWKRPYPHGNKIIAACDMRGTSHSIFLDTDIVCMQPLSRFMDLPVQSFAAAPEGRPTWGQDGRWERAYAHFGLPVPNERVTLLRAGRIQYPPYFNAGFIAFNEAEHPSDGKRFAQHWLETAFDFDHNCGIAFKRPWLDQITLPLTKSRFNYDCEVLGEAYNYSLSGRITPEDTPDFAILHYHRTRYLTPTPQWQKVKQIVTKYMPARFHAALAAYLHDLENPAPPEEKAEDVLE